MGYGQFGEEAKLNLPEEIDTLRSTVKVVGNNIVMGLAEGRMNKAKAAKGEGEEEDDDDEEEDLDEGPDSPDFSGTIDERGSLGVLIDGMKSDEDEDLEPDSPSSSEGPSSSYDTRPTARNSNSFQLNLSTAKEDLSLKGKLKLNSTDLNRGNEGLDETTRSMEEKSGRRVSRRKMYRASRIGTPLLKGALEEVVRLSLEEDKVTERQREKEREEQGIVSVEEEKKPQVQRRARKPTPPLKKSLGETASRLLLGKGKSEEHQAAGSTMFDVLAGEFLKASVVLETAEADGAKEGQTSTSRGGLAHATPANVSDSLDVENGVTETFSDEVENVD